MKTIKFVKPHSPYAVGDIAGVPDKEAEGFIEAEVAVLFKKNGKGEEVQPESKVIEKPVEDKMVKKAKNK